MEKFTVLIITIVIILFLHKIFLYDTKSSICKNLSKKPFTTWDETDKKDLSSLGYMINPNLKADKSSVNDIVSRNIIDICGYQLLPLS